MEAKRTCVSDWDQYKKDVDDLFVKFDTLDDPILERDLFCTQTYLKHHRSLKDRIRDRLFLLVLTGRWKSKSKDLWYNRLWTWEEHINKYLDIAGKAAPRDEFFPVKDHGTKRIDYLADRLKVLDGKFSMLLAVNSVLAGFVGLSIKETYDLFNHNEFWPSLEQKWTFLMVLFSILAVTIIISLSNVWYGIRGFRRVVWGELTLFEDLSRAEEAHSRFLMISLARRTNMFRMVSRFTRYAYVMFFIFVFIASIALGSVLYQAKRMDETSSPSITLPITAPPPPALEQLVPMSRDDTTIPAVAPKKESKHTRRQKRH